MKHGIFISVMIFLIVCSSCENEENIIVPSTSKNKIMPLGASRVEGARPLYESYRYELWKDLVDNGIEFDYIGVEQDDASYSDYNGLQFDNDHEGRGGWTSGQILGEIEASINQTGAPDIVLFSSPGGNDGLQGLSFSEAVDNVNDIIDIIQNANPNVTIIIEQMAPARSDAMTNGLASFMNAMNQEVINIAAAQSDNNSEVLVVDMATGYNDSYCADEVHYNEAGAEFIADRYYAVLEDLLEE